MFFRINWCSSQSFNTILMSSSVNSSWVTMATFVFLMFPVCEVLGLFSDCIVTGSTHPRDKPFPRGLYVGCRADICDWLEWLGHGLSSPQDIAINRLLIHLSLFLLLLSQWITPPFWLFCFSNVFPFRYQNKSTTVFFSVMFSIKKNTQTDS